MSIPVEVDIINTGLDKLLYQFKDQPDIVALITSYLKQLGSTQEDSLYLLESRGIDNASGLVLDSIGKLVGEARAGDTDEPYRSRILDRVEINNSEGTPKNVLDILKKLTGASSVKLFEHYPANIHLYTNGTDGDLDSIRKVMSDSVPAGTSDVTIIEDKGLGVFTPSELNLTSSVEGTLVTSGGDAVVTAAGDTISLVSYKLSGSNTLALLAEPSTEGLCVSINGIVSEVLSNSDGITTEDTKATFYTASTNAVSWAEVYNKRR